jgi:hypothetical protein
MDTDKKTGWLDWWISGLLVETRRLQIHQSNYPFIQKSIGG